MNLIDLFSLNKHGDYQEVLFSSALSYLLDPEGEHKLKNKLLSKLVEEWKWTIPENVTFEAEHNFGTNIGKIDQLVQYNNYILGIEVKINDRSSNNYSKKDGKHQLIRYAEELEKMAEEFDKDWKLLFIIPDDNSKKAKKYFKKCKDQFGKNVHIMAWMDEIIPNDGAMDTSMQRIFNFLLEELKKGEDAKTHWLIDSIVKFIKDGKLTTQTPEEGRFPSKSDIKKYSPDYWKLLEPWVKIVKRSPRRNTTTIGIPYGHGDNKAKLNRDSLYRNKNTANTLYRIRTTRDYYLTKKEKKANYPTGPLILELWLDNYDNCADELSKLSEHTRGGIHISKIHRHIDSYKNLKVKLIKITRVLKEDEIDKFETILRKTFPTIDNQY